MISLFIAFVVAPSVWLAFEVFRAPVAGDGPGGFYVIEPGRRLEDLLPLKFGHAAPLVFWGLD